MNDSHELFGNGGVRIAVIGTLAILALFLFVKTAAVAQNVGRPEHAATDTITVSASGQSRVAPDVARISFTVTHTAKTVKEAQAETTKQTNAAVAYAREQKIADKDIKTLYYNISPQYEYPSYPPCPAGSMCPAYEYRGAPKITGYQVSQSIQLTIRDLDATGTILGGLGELGVQNLYGPELTLDDPTAGQNAARADAIMKAKIQANTLADQLGVRLGRIVSFNESSGGYYYAKAYATGGAMEADAGAPAPEVPTGENEYSANVTITYEIR